MAVRAPDDRRFRRAQVTPVRRRRSRLRLLALGLRRALLVVLVGVGAYHSAHAVLASSALTVQRVVVRGNVRLSTGEVLELVGGLRGEHVLRADLDAWRDRVLASPWVNEATLRRLLPSTVEIEIVERLPLAIGRLGGRLYLLDAEGTIIDEYGPQYAEFDLPIVDGLDEGAGAATPPDAEKVALVARVIAEVAGEADLRDRLSQVDVSDTRNAVVMIDGDPARLQLGDTAFAERLRSYIDLEPTLRARVPDIDYVDLRFDSRIYVRPTPGSMPAAGSPAPAVAR